MAALRTLLTGKGYWAMVLIALALTVKLVVPAGYMLASSAPLTMQVIVCAPVSGQSHSFVTIPMEKDSGKATDDLGGQGEQCTFGSLSHALLGGADAVLLALAFAFILVLGRAPQQALSFEMPSRIRPPLRAPPVAA